MVRNVREDRGHLVHRKPTPPFPLATIHTAGSVCPRPSNYSSVYEGGRKREDETIDGKVNLVCWARPPRCVPSHSILMWPELTLTDCPR